MSSIYEKCSNEYYRLKKTNPDIGDPGPYIANCIAPKTPPTPSFGQRVQSAYNNLPKFSDLANRAYNAGPNITGRARTFYMNNINTDQNGNPIGIRPEQDANGHRGGKRRTQKSKGAKKSRKAKGGKRKGRKSRRHN
uniref:Uncharacterized protein n=1 Tax=viral metagenome TaxID=1070528 RepID=A0A6C0LCF2_9ZZZZ